MAILKRAHHKEADHGGEKEADHGGKKERTKKRLIMEAKKKG